MSELNTAPLPHYWIMPSTARLTQEEAEEFADVRGRADTPVELMPGEVRCARCDESVESAAEACAGFNAGESFPHRWAGLFRVSLSEFEARAWTDEGEFPSLSPQGIGLVCVLCGSEWSVAEPECREQRFLFGASGA